MKVIICAGGPQPNLPTKMMDNTVTIGVDRGALALIEAGFTLDVALGDFDSVSNEELIRIKTQTKKIIEYSAEKDDTDFQIALHYVATHYLNAECIEIYGALSGKGRVDHFLSNIWIGHDERFKAILAKLCFIETTHKMQFLFAGEHIIKPQDYYYLSFISLTPVTALSIQGAKYELSATDFNTPYALISNEFVDDNQNVIISFSTGILVALYVALDR